MHRQRSTAITILHAKLRACTQHVRLLGQFWGSTQMGSRQHCVLATLTCMLGSPYAWD
jgi:hypothetical protein